MAHDRTVKDSAARQPLHLRAPVRAFNGWVPAHALQRVVGLNAKALADCLDIMSSRWEWSADRRWVRAVANGGSDPC